MAGFLDRLLNRNQTSAQQAKERLKLVLVNDRTDLNPREMNLLKDDLVEAISRHIEIDPSTVKIQVTQEGRKQRLIADIPLKPVRQRRGK
jgi:cell division topological specificity factor